MQEEFEYSNNLKECYNQSYNNQIICEWRWCVNKATGLEQELQAYGLKRPRSRARSISRSTAQQFNMALNRNCKENNRMKMHYIRAQFSNDNYVATSY